MEPIPNEVLCRTELIDLFLYLEAEGVRVITQPDRMDPLGFVRVEGCDGSNRHTRAWAATRELDERRVLAYFDAEGCPCDCSVIGDLDLRRALREGGWS